MFKESFPLWDENNEGSGGSSGTNSELDSIKAEVERLKSHNNKLLDEKKKIQASLKRFDGIDPENIKNMMQVLESNEEAKLLADGKLDEVLNKRTEKMRISFEQKLNDIAEESQTTKKENEHLKDQYNDLVINTEIRKQAEKSGVIPAAIDDVISRAGGVFSLDKDGNIESRNSDGDLVTIKKKPLTPELFIEKLKENAPHFWPASKGAGATGGTSNGMTSGANPWMPGKNFSLTEQSRLTNTDPERAQVLKAAAESAN